MESPGEYLKREREHRGVSLADVFKATRVPMKHLEALEADNYDTMPHPTFVKGYIKSICKVLGLDETDAVLRYDIYLRERADSSEAAKAAKAAARPPRPRKVQQPPLLGEFWGNRRNIAMAAGGAGVVIIIIIAAFIFGSRGPEPGPEATPQEAAQVEPDAAAGKDAPAEAAPAAKPEPVRPEPVKAAPEPVKAKRAEAPKPRHSLVVKATATVWIQAAIDNGEPFDVTLKEGETIVWKAVEGITLKIGNAGGVDLSFDGKRLAPVGEPGYVVSLALPGGKVKVLARPKPEQEPEPVEPEEPAGEGSAVKTPEAGVEPAAAQKDGAGQDEGGVRPDAPSGVEGAE